MNLSFRLAVRMLLIVLCAMIGYHLLVMAGVFPFIDFLDESIDSVTLMHQTEMLNILGNLFLLIVVLVRAGLVPYKVPTEILNLFVHWIALLYTLSFVDAFSYAISADFSKVGTAIFSTFVVLICCRIAQEPIEEEVPKHSEL
jgi:hypothetical protein